jgi:hypothetical protein
MRMRSGEAETRRKSSTDLLAASPLLRFSLYATKVGRIMAITIIITTPSNQRIKAIVQADAPLIFSPVCLKPVTVSHQP